MKKAIFLTIAISLFIFAQEGWVRIYGSVGEDFGNCIQQTCDGNYIVSGQRSGDNWLLMLDSNGDTLWSRLYGSGQGFSVQETHDGGFVIAGYCGNFGIESSRLILIKTDSLGETLWEFKDTETYYKYACVQQISDSNYVVTGRSLFRILKIDRAGYLIWDQPIAIFCRSVRETNDGGFITAGTYNHAMTLCKMTPSGYTEWTRSFPRGYESNGYWAEQTSDGGYVLCGAPWVLIKTDDLGDTLWTTYYNTGACPTYCVQEVIGKGFITTGYEDLDGLGPSEPDNIRLMLLNEIGDTVWRRTFQAPSDDVGSFVRLTNDTGYIIVGSTKSFGLKYNDLIAIKTDSEGRVPVLVSPTRSIAPSPGGDHLAMNPKAQFTNFGTEEAIADFYCHCEIIDLNDTISLYHNSVYVSESLGPWQSREIEFSEWTAHSVSNYQAKFYATEAGNGQDMVVSFRWTGIEEQPSIHQPTFEVATAVGPNIVLRFADASGPQGGCVAVFDATGRIVDEIDMPQAGGVVSWPSTAEFGPGVYFFRDVDGSQTQKAVLLK